MPAPALRLVPIAAVLGLTGCFLFQQPPGAGPGTQGSGEPGLVLEGAVRVGAEGTAAAISPLTSQDPLTVQAPLANNSGGALIGNTGGALGAITELADEAPLSAGAALVGNSGGALVGNSGGALVGNAGAGLVADRLTAAVGGADHVLFIEVVDGETAQLLYRTRADEQGRYRIDLGPARERRGLVVQATAVRGSAVTAYLAAPFPVRKGEHGTRKIDATPGSTLALFSQAVLAGVRAELKVGKGFRGFRAGGLARLLPFGDPDSAARASEALDRAEAYTKATSFDAVLGAAADHSAALAKAAADQGLQAGGTVASIVAATNLILAEIAAKPPSAAESLDAYIQVSAARVSADAVRAAAGEIQAEALKAGKAEVVSVPIATPTPAGATPEPTPGPTATPAPNGLSVTTLPGSSLGIARGAALDGEANLYVNRGQSIRKIKPDGAEIPVPILTTDGVATVFEPYGFAFDQAGNLFIVEGARHRIHKLTPSGHLSVFAGATTSQSGFVDALGTAARFKTPYGIAVDHEGNLLVADSGNNAVRKIDPDGLVSTLQTGGVELSMPSGVAVGQDGSVYVACYSGHRIVRIKDGAGSVFAGSGQFGHADGPAETARFYYPMGVAVAGDGHVLVADSQNRRIRHIDENGLVTTHAGSGADGQGDGPALEATFVGPAAVNWALDGRIIVLDGGRVRVIQ